MSPPAAAVAVAVPAQAIADFLGGELQVPAEPRESLAQTLIRRPAPIGDAQPGELAFLGPTAREPAALLGRTRASLLIVDRTLYAALQVALPPSLPAVILSDNARLDFLRVLRRYFTPPQPRGVHPSAVVDPSAELSEDVYVGPLASIGAGVRIGRGSVIHAGVHIYRDVTIGEAVTIHSGTVIGADGFGYERSASGELEKFPHLGSVIIEDGVEIGANACIDRGTLGATRVCRGARIDNLVHLAHNTHIGRNTAVIALAMVGGSTHVEDEAWIAPSACLRDRIRVGRAAVVGLQSLVTRDVPPGETVMGAPARPQAAQRRLLAELSRLAEPDEPPR